MRVESLWFKILGAHTYFHAERAGESNEKINSKSRSDKSACEFNNGKTYMYVCTCVYAFDHVPCIHVCLCLCVCMWYIFKIHFHRNLMACDKNAIDTIIVVFIYFLNMLLLQQILNWAILYRLNEHSMNLFSVISFVINISQIKFKKKKTIQKENAHIKRQRIKKLYFDLLFL